MIKAIHFVSLFLFISIIFCIFDGFQIINNWVIMAGSIEELQSINAAMQATDLELFAERSIGKIEFAFDNGDASIRNLMNKPGIAIAEGSMPKGTIVPLHQHKGSKEFFIVYQGAMTIVCECGDRYELRLGSMCSIDKNNLHTIHVIEDCRFVTITIPADPLFPN